MISTTITPDDVAVALGVPAPSQDSPLFKQWAMWISDAVMLIQARVDSMSPTPAVSSAPLDYVIREAVVAQVKRPDDATQVTVSVDDGSTSRTYASSTGRVAILDSWWDLLGLAGDGGRAYSIDTVPARGAVHMPWCSARFLASYCSCGADLTNGEYPLYEGGSLSQGAGYL